MSEINSVTTLWTDYQNGLSYQSSSGLARKLPKFVKFYEGDQWAKATENTKTLPRPVVNIIKMICRNKKSAILSVPVRIVYRAEDGSVNVQKFNRFSDYITKELGQEALDKRAIDDAVKKGTYIYHYYWDTEAKGKDGSVEGGVRCELIDPLNIFFSDPTQADEQKQEWILIASRESVKSVQAKCDKDIDKDSIASDENESKYGTIEQEGDKLCTVLTRYFRKDGEVYCEKATKSVIFNKAFPIAPDLVGAGRELGFEEDAPNNDLPDNQEGESLTPLSVMAELYPIVVGQYENREGSIYGLGEVEGLVPTQKAINFNLAMMLLNVQEMAWGKYIVDKDALKGQVITNTPGQTLVDYSGTMNGIKKLAETGMNTFPIALVETLTNFTRTVTGSTEVMTGETLGSGMSGAAIAALQSQAQQPIEELKDAFWLVKEKQGKVLAQFYKLFYMGKEFSYEEEMPPVDENGMPIEGAPLEETQLTDIFNGQEYQGVQFSVVVEATAGTKATTAGDINALDVMLANKLITPKMYFELYPDEALTNRTEILKKLEQAEQGQVQQLTAQLEQMQMALQQSQMQVQQLATEREQQQKTVDRVVSVIKENNELRAVIAQLYVEGKTKIQQANEQIKMGNAKIMETTKDAQDFAQHIYENEVQGGVGNGMPQMQNGTTSQTRSR